MMISLIKVAFLRLKLSLRQLITKWLFCVPGQSDYATSKSGISSVSKPTLFETRLAVFYAYFGFMPQLCGIITSSARRGNLEVVCKSTGFMKILQTVSLLIFLNSILFAQTNQQQNSKPTEKELSVEQSQILTLPVAKRNFRPKLSLQRALQLADSYIKKEKIDISSFYLYQAKFIMYGSKDNQQPAWHLWWLNEDGAVGNYVEILVMINTGNVGRLPSM